MIADRCTLANPHCMRLSFPENEGFSDGMFRAAC